MVKVVSAIAASALIAGVASISALTASVEASTPPAAVKGDRLDIRPIGAACSQNAWPYYETKCMRDRTQPAGHTRATRLISLDRAQTTK
jgi:hypothetical protein